MNKGSASSLQRLCKLTAEGGDSLKQLGATSAPSATGVQLAFHCKLVTPALLGGADPRAPDSDQPIRVKDVRGKLRMWWRILAQSGDLDAELATWRTGNSGAQSHRDIEDLIWGSIHGTVPNRGVLVVSIDVDPHQRAVFTPYEVEFIERRNDGQTRKKRKPADALAGYRYALEFAKAPAKEPVNQTRNVLGAGYAFQLNIICHHPELEDAILKVVWAWMRFSGVGSRTSRGIGSIHAEPLNSEVAFKPQPKLAAASRMSVGAFGSAEEAVQWGLRALQSFCQGEVGRNGHMGRSRWPEADTIRRISGTHFDEGVGHHIHDPNNGLAGTVNAFPRLAFGHRAIRFHPDQTKGSRRSFRTPDPDEHLLVPAGADRLPSSLLIRPARVPDDRRKGKDWVCMLVQMTHLSQLIRTMAIPVSGPSGATDVPVWQLGWRAGVPGACSQVSALENTALMHQAGQPGTSNPKDAAQAFMNYAWNLWTK